MPHVFFEQWEQCGVIFVKHDLDLAEENGV